MNSAINFAHFRVGVYQFAIFVAKLVEISHAREQLNLWLFLELPINLSVK